MFVTRSSFWIRHLYKRKSSAEANKVGPLLQTRDTDRRKFEPKFSTGRLLTQVTHKYSTVQSKCSSWHFLPSWDDLTCLVELVPKDASLNILTSSSDSVPISVHEFEYMTEYTNVCMQCWDKTKIDRQRGERESAAFVSLIGAINVPWYYWYQ